MLLLGQLAFQTIGGAAPSNISSIILLVILFVISLKPELMEKVEFLFSQLALMICLALSKIISTINLLALLGNIKLIPAITQLNPVLFIVATILQIAGYVSIIFCLIKLNFHKENKPEDKIES